MKKTSENISGILLIIDTLNDKYPEREIGEYIEHYLTENGTYKVLLSNNTTIEIHRSVAQDAEQFTFSIDEESLARIINTYKLI